MKVGHRAAALLLTIVGGCFTPGRDDQGDGYVNMMPDDLPSQMCGTSTGPRECETTTAAIGGSAGDATPDNEECLSSEDCQSGSACLAKFRNGERLPFVCVSTCITLMDEANWCIDAAACCDQGATCSSRGYCLLPEPGGTT